eukprot:TRINITY_DN200_c0_g2_i1.p1 TRINITY_DN200_c0_g2~~TRINITY_DN200_c0_g2_i1.p1  ORF type:complete len:241 (+),score=62.43 TRINITY_DN200_c0_g2_i1:99-821(+)
MSSSRNNRLNGDSFVYSYDEYNEQQIDDKENNNNNLIVDKDINVRRCNGDYPALSKSNLEEYKKEMDLLHNQWGFDKSHIGPNLTLSEMTLVKNEEDSSVNSYAFGNKQFIKGVYRWRVKITNLNKNNEMVAFGVIKPSKINQKSKVLVKRFNGWGTTNNFFTDSSTVSSGGIYFSGDRTVFLKLDCKLKKLTLFDQVKSDAINKVVFHIENIDLPVVPAFLLKNENNTVQISFDDLPDF